MHSSLFCACLCAALTLGCLFAADIKGGDGQGSTRERVTWQISDCPSSDKRQALGASDALPLTKTPRQDATDKSALGLPVIQVRMCISAIETKAEGRTIEAPESRGEAGSVTGGPSLNTGVGLVVDGPSPNEKVESSPSGSSLSEKIEPAVDDLAMYEGEEFTVRGSFYGEAERFMLLEPSNRAGAWILMVPAQSGALEEGMEVLFVSAESGKPLLTELLHRKENQISLMEALPPTLQSSMLAEFPEFAKADPNRNVQRDEKEGSGSESNSD